MTLRAKWTTETRRHDNKKKKSSIFIDLGIKKLELKIRHQTESTQLIICFAGFSFCLLFYPQNGGDMFLWNIGISPNYTALQGEAKHWKYKKLKFDGGQAYDRSSD
jgi:hypothetical protein